MLENELSFDGFVCDVDPRYHGFVRETHEFMLRNGCKLKLSTAKNGYVVSYSHIKGKRAVLNFVFRKIGLIARIYGDNVGQYVGFLESLPDKMKESIEEAPLCKRFEDPPRCNSKCGGYVFSLGGSQHQKCRYSCFMFVVDDESIPLIGAFLENELKMR